MRSFYISSFIKIRSSIRKIKHLHFHDSPSSPPPHRWSNRRDNCYQVNLCRSLTRLPIFIVLARPEAPNSPKHWKSPQLPHREQILSGYVNHLSTTYVDSSRQVSCRSLHSKRFPRFPVSKISVSPSNPLCLWVQFELKMEHLKQKTFLSFIQILLPICKIEIPQFSRFPRFLVSPPTPPNVIGSIQDLK